MAKRIGKEAYERIISLRTSGLSIPEIVNLTGSAKTTVQRYVKGTVVSEILLERLREKQGGAKDRAIALRESRLNSARLFLGHLSKRDYALILVALYWGEGTKRDFSIVNSDPRLLQTFLHSLLTNGISLDRISLSLRLHGDLSVTAAKEFWSRTLGVPKTHIGRTEVIVGKKKGKLPYGMCRIRVRKGIRDRLLIQSAILLIGKDASERVLSP